MSDPFDVFWPAYPRRKNKVAARDAFRWALQHFNQDGRFLERVLEALEWQRKELPNPQFWPEPYKWLLKERWTDEPLEEVIEPTARERAEYRQWCFSLGPSARGVSLEDWVRRQRRTA